MGWIVGGVLVVIGLLGAGFGVLAMGDPEGRGGSFIILVLAGAAVFLAGLGTLGVMTFRALFG